MGFKQPLVIGDFHKRRQQRGDVTHGQLRVLPQTVGLRSLLLCRPVQFFHRLFQEFRGVVRPSEIDSHRAVHGHSMREG